MSDGGGLWISSASLNITHSLIADNKSSGDYGGGIYFSTAWNQTFRGVTITNNISNSEGGGIYINTSSNDIFIENSIVWNNAPDRTTSDGAGGNILIYNRGKGGNIITNNVRIPTTKLKGIIERPPYYEYDITTDNTYQRYRMFYVDDKGIIYYWKAQD